MMYGLWRKHCASDLTKLGLSLVQYGYLEQAEELFGEATRMALAGTVEVRGWLGGWLPAVGCTGPGVPAWAAARGVAGRLDAAP